MLNIGEFARLGQVSPRMLRHYDEIGLLRPDRVDQLNGYRLYSLSQLGRLHRIVALRDLGFTLDQITQTLSGDISVEALRGMLQLRHAQIEGTVQQERERLRRVEAHLRALEWSTTMELQDIVIKKTLPLRAALATAEDLSQPEVGDAFGRLIPQVLAHLATAGAKPGISVGTYEMQGTIADGGMTLHAGFDIGDQEVPAGEGVEIVDLPVIEVAAATYRGGVEGIPGAWEALVRWIDDSGYQLAGDCRELYYEWDVEDSSGNVVEFQQPIAR